MKQDLNSAAIDCPLFEKHRFIIQSQKNNLFKSARPIEISIFAEEIWLEAGRMQHCSSYDSHSVDCIQCQAIAREQERISAGHFDIKETA